MIRPPRSVLGQDAAVIVCVWLIVSVTAGCTWVMGKGKPGWVDGQSSEYPPIHYLTGVGQADNRNGAADQAYAALARIFKAEVAAQAKDWESYFLVENRDVSNAERRLTIDNVTSVSTEKVLENVRILDTWYDAKNRMHYALAVMNRSQADTALTDKLVTVDRAIDADVTEARQTTDKLAKIRALRRAGRNLILREAYNADLRVIRTSGQGVSSTYRLNELSIELGQFLARNLVLAIQVSGDHAEPAQRALTTGLVREGLHVTTKIETAESGSSELLVRGRVRLFPMEIGDPHFKYVRWCSDFEVVERVTQRVVGAVAQGGKEGHLTEQEATAKTLRVIQQAFSSDVARAIAAHIFGEVILPTAVTMPAGCPREESSVKR
jgi:hypothetical protein